MQLIYDYAWGFHIDWSLLNKSAEKQPGATDHREQKGAQITWAWNQGTSLFQLDRSPWNLRGRTPLSSWTTSTLRSSDPPQAQGRPAYYSSTRIGQPTREHKLCHRLASSQQGTGQGQQFLGVSALDPFWWIMSLLNLVISLKRKNDALLKALISSLDI